LEDVLPVVAEADKADDVGADPVVDGEVERVADREERDEGAEGDDRQREEPPSLRIQTIDEPGAGPITVASRRPRASLSRQRDRPGYLGSWSRIRFASASVSAALARITGIGSRPAPISSMAAMMTWEMRSRTWEVAFTHGLAWPDALVSSPLRK